VPDDGYQVAYWDGACLFSGQSTQCSLSNIRSDQRTTVSFTTSAQQEQVDIPTLSQWGMILLAGLLLMLAWRTGDLGTQALMPHRTEPPDHGRFRGGIVN
jgi:hypothetical protein